MKDTIRLTKREKRIVLLCEKKAMKQSYDKFVFFDQRSMLIDIIERGGRHLLNELEQNDILAKDRTANSIPVQFTKN